MTMLAGSQIYGYNTNTTFDNTGTLVSSPGSTGTATLAGGSLVVNNTGSIQLASGILDVASATLNLDTGSVSGTGTLDVQGTLVVTANQTLGVPLVFSGMVNGTGALTITGSLTTNGGNFEGPGTVTVASGATWGIEANTTTVSGGTLINDGTATIDATAGLYLGSGTTVTNGGTMTMLAGSQIYGYNTNTTFDNTGTLVSSPGSTGTANLTGGSLVFNNTGSIQLASGTLDLSAATLNLNPGSSVTGTGTLDDQGTLGVNTAQSLAVPLEVSGAVTGTGSLTVTGTLTTNGGNFEGPGTVTVASGATWETTTSSSTTVSGGTLVNDGTATLNATATLAIGSGATVTNGGTMTMLAGSQIYGYSTNTTFDNTG